MWSEDETPYQMYVIFWSTSWVIWKKWNHVHFIRAYRLPCAQNLSKLLLRGWKTKPPIKCTWFRGACWFSSFQNYFRLSLWFSGGIKNGAWCACFLHWATSMRAMSYFNTIKWKIWQGNEVECDTRTKNQKQKLHGSSAQVNSSVNWKYEDLAG